MNKHKQDVLFITLTSVLILALASFGMVRYEQHQRVLANQQHAATVAHAEAAAVQVQKDKALTSQVASLTTQKASICAYIKTLGTVKAPAVLPAACQ